MNKMIWVAAPAPSAKPEPSDAERRKRAFEQLRRNLLSMVKQVDTIMELDARQEMDDRAA